MTEEEAVAASSTPATYPRKVKLTLVLDLELRDSEQEAYILAAPGSAVLQIGFIADLFDLLNFEAAIGVEKINGFTHAQVTKTLQAGL